MGVLEFRGYVRSLECDKELWYRGREYRIKATAKAGECCVTGYECINIQLRSLGGFLHINLAQECPFELSIVSVLQMKKET